MATGIPVDGIFPMGSHIRGVGAIPDGSGLVVADWGARSIHLLNSAGVVADTLAIIGIRPADVAITPDGAYAYVPVAGADGVVVVDTSTMMPVPTSPLTVGTGPGGVAVAPDGAHAYVTNVLSGTISVIDTATNTVSGTIPTPMSAPRAIAITPDGTRAYFVTSSTLKVLDLATGVVSPQLLALSEAGQKITIMPDGGSAYVSAAGAVTQAVDVFDLDSPPAITTAALPGGTAGTAYSSQVAATGTPAPTFAVTAGVLPPGLGLAAVSGAVTGAPTTPGTYTFTVTASATVSGIPMNAAREYTIAVAAVGGSGGGSGGGTDGSAGGSSGSGRGALASTGSEDGAGLPLVAIVLLVLGGGVVGGIRATRRRAA